MQRLEVSSAVRPVYESLGVKRLSIVNRTKPTSRYGVIINIVICVQLSFIKRWVIMRRRRELWCVQWYCPLLLEH